ncbi:MULTISPECIES: DUF445 domain-containing protein [unclassified Saccharibacter]|uniref:DUF445 domain-containing protein n=1 Tax=unclassified Saccharibacter TaxID=2648722 RepID=UPI0013245D4B|nr:MULTISPECIES: DUF445 domain-containing protein [unclassified Saccharibacter]MXV35445.1 DUF445 family protein [Saccharibacter sp. EH611]MXV58105.1 DUF445 family protein [Saccharibacter sp. EH70]MXV65379.1 DUF445 family protein [Saccharibacter sp. EH60]
MSEAHAPEQSRLSRPGTVATVLLVGMGGLAVGSSLPIWERLYAHSVVLDMIQAGARAGVVGGLADWFAVTALFRHPMGLPIPHTAILPRRKKQLGQAMGRFVAEHFFTEHDLTALLERFDCSKALVKTLQNPTTRDAVVDNMRRITPGLLERLEDGRGSALAGRLLPVLLHGRDVAPLVARVLRAMVNVDVHQEVFSFFLSQFKELVVQHEPEFHRFVEERVREQGGRFVGWAIGGRVASQALNALKMELERVDPMDSDIRHGFTTWVNEKIDQLEKDPAQLTRVMEHISDFLGHDAVKEWWGSLWRRLRIVTEDDSQRSDGWSAQVSQALLDHVIDILSEDKEFSAKINHIVSRSAVHMIAGIRQEVAALIARVMEKWDGPSLAARLERGVGKDLAYIRINGTVVGFLVGGLLEALLGLVARL